MSSSESEAFESADEDFVNQQKATPDHKKKLVKSKESEKQPVTKLKETSESNSGVRVTTEPNTINNNNGDESTNKIVESEKLDPLDRCVTPPSIVYCWEEGCTNTNLPTIETACNVTKDKDENLDNRCKNEPKKSVEQKESESVADDGWSDFDDWGDEDDVEEKKDDSKQQQDVLDKEDVNSVFPVLKELSTPEYGKKTEKGLFQNLSKYVGKPNLSVGSSSYDTFPILDELSSNKKRTNDYQYPEEKEVESPKTENSEQTHKETTLSSSSSWGWTPWGGVVSLLSTATEGVTSLTSQVGHSLSSVIESSIGVPDPEEMARMQKQLGTENKNNSNEEDLSVIKEKSNEDTVLHGFGHIVSGVTSIGNKVITGGLNTLEDIGKKTMTILQENDPLLRKKRKLLGLDDDKPVLSQVLREAKKKSEETENNLKQMQKHLYKKQLHFETLFDQYHGLVHLEALEMLSRQSSIRLESLMQPLTGKALAEVRETLEEVEEFCDLGDMDNYDTPDDLYSVNELSKKLESSVEDLGIKVEFTDILKCWENNLKWFNAKEEHQPQEIYDKSLRCLAETTALIVHKMHKIAELILIKDHHSTANEADSIVQLTTTFCWHLNGLANCFARKLNTFDSSEENSSMITSIFLEESNSTSCIRNVFQLFIPILQVGAV